MKKHLFGEFPPVSKSEWIEQAIKDLKGKSYEKTLHHKLAGGIDVASFYTREDLSKTKIFEKYKDKVNPQAEIPGISPRYWSNAFSISGENEKTANTRILEALQEGADALILQLNGDEDLEVLLSNVKPQYIEIFLKPVNNPAVVLQIFLFWLEKQGIAKDKVKGGLLWDSFAVCFTERRSREAVIEGALEILKLGIDYPYFKTLCIDSSVYHNAGADVVQEVSYAIAAFIDLVDGLGPQFPEAAQIFSKTFIKTAVGGDFFLEIAKVRSLRILLHGLFELYDVQVKPEDIYILAESSLWSKSAVDPETNMLRNTTEAMSAILGGCNGLHVLQHDIAVAAAPTVFAQRMALNISNILKEESYLDKMLDPVAGSYYLENLILALSDKIKQRLIAIENKNGWWAEYQEEAIQKQIKTVRENKMRAVVNGATIKIGVNKYIPFEKRTVNPAQLETEEATWQLFSGRESMLAEKTTINS
jgi:methylmalonyl-CoA mutase